MALPAIEPAWEDALRGGTHWSAVLRRGQVLRLLAGGERANVSALLYSREQPLERYNMADTLKAQHTAHLTAGCVCYSDMGRVLCSITADTLGWHDPLGGFTDDALVRQRYGATSFQRHRNERRVSAREALLVEMGKYGLGERDLIAGINFFSKVWADESGALHWQDDHAHAGDGVDLRFEMDSIVLLYNGPHPLDPAPVWAPPDVRLQLWHAAPVAGDDLCRRRCPENERGFINTERHCSA